MLTSPSSTDWLAIQVRPNRENPVLTGLSNKGYEVFLPTYKERRRRRSEHVERPLFSGYIFCRGSAKSFGKILTQPGVLRIVGIGRSPAYVPQKEIDAIRSLIDAEVAARPWTYLPTGTQVKVENGPLEGVEGTLLSGEKHRNLILSVHLLQRSTRVELDDSTVITVVKRPTTVRQ